MKWVILFWIRGCAGLDCEIPAYEVRVFESEPACYVALEFWMKSSPKMKTKTIYKDGNKLAVNDHTGQHVGICFLTDKVPDNPRVKSPGGA